MENEILVATKGVVMIKAQKNIGDQKLKDLKAKKIFFKLGIVWS